MIQKLNIHLGLNDTIYKYLDPSFNAIQVANAHQWALNYEEKTTIPTVFVSTPTPYPISNYNPYTFPSDTITVNVTPGASTCIEYGCVTPEGEITNTGATITDDINLERKTNKEDNRMLGMKEHANGPSNMNPIPAEMTDKDCGTVIVAYNLARDHFKYQKHDDHTIMSNIGDHPSPFVPTTATDK